MSASLPIFTPRAAAPEDLDRVTVGRADLIDRVVGRLRETSRGGARAHTLVVGPRGSGKTHLLAVALHRARGDGETASGLAVAVLPEDALSIGSYEDLLTELVRHLDPDARERAAKLRLAKDARGLERLLDDLAGRRALVLVIENLDRVFAAIGPSGAAALRGFVESAASILVLASTPLLFDGVSSRGQAWYGSFDAEHLQELSLAEGTELVRRRAMDREAADLAAYVLTPTGQGRLGAVEALAGGSPRLWQILAEVVDVETLDALLPAVQQMMDGLAPYYQRRLWELAPAEQKLVVEMARGLGATTVGDLAEAVGMSNRAAATALGRLAEARWVRGVKVAGADQRRTWYELREPLLRHHLQFRESRGEPLRFIVDVLRLWYSPEERLRDRAGGLTEASSSLEAVGWAVRAEGPLVLRLPVDRVREALPGLAFSVVMPPDRARELAELVDQPDVTRLLLVGQLLTLPGESRHTEWLDAFGSVPADVRRVGESLDGDPIALAELPKELRQLVRDRLVGAGRS